MTVEQLGAEPSVEMISKMAENTLDYRIWMALTLAKIGRKTDEHSVALQHLTDNGCSMAPQHRDIEKRVASLESGKQHTLGTPEVPSRELSLFRGLVDLRNYTPKELAFILAVLCMLGVHIVNRVDIGRLKTVVETVAASPVTTPAP